MDVILRTFEKNKVSIALFAANLGILALAYSVYLLTPHFSCDTYAALSPGDLANVNISHGRFMHYLLYSVLDAVGCDLPQHLRATQLMFTVVCAFGVSLVAKRFYDALGSKRVLHLMLLDVLSALIIVNPYFLSGWYYWPESCVGASMGMLVSFLSLMAWCSPKKNWKRRVVSLVLVTLAANMYQVYLEFFFSVALAYTLLENSYDANLATVLDLVCATAWCGIAGASTIASFNVLEAAGVEMSRSFSEPVGLWSRLHDTALTQHDIMVTGYGMFPKGFLVACIVFFAAAALVSIVRWRAKLQASGIILTAVALIAAYASSFAPELASLNVPVPRIFVGVFSLPLFVGSIFLYTVKDSRVGSMVGCCAAVIALCISTACVLSAEIDTVKCNAYDEAQLVVIQDALHEYESSTGTKIETVLYGIDPSGDELVPGVDPVFDVNKRGMRTSWFFKWILKDRLGEQGAELEIELLSKDEQDAVFGDSDWNWFEPAEQIVFDGSTMYVIMY